MTTINEIPLTDVRKTENGLSELIPWFQNVMKYFMTNLDTVKSNLIKSRIGKEFDIKEHTFHLEGFTSTSFDKRVAQKFACKYD